jgi:chromosome segregation ATPase
MATYSDKTTRWEQLLTSIAANAEELGPAVQAERSELEQALAEAKQLDIQQDLLRAQTAERTRRRRELDAQGEELRRRLAAIIKGKYGTRNNKLKEFGLEPFKPGRRKPEPETPEPPEPPQTKAEPAAKS